MSSKASTLMLSIFVLGLAAMPGEAAPPPKNVFFGSAQRTDPTTSTTFAELVPTPGQVFTTTGQSTFLVQFFGSARLSDAGKAMDIRAVVDGHPLNPTNGMRFSGTGFTSISYSGFLSNIGPGQHKVTLQWLVTGGTGFMSNRTFIIWVFPQ